MFYTTYVLCSLTLLKLKTEGRTIYTENVTQNLQKWSKKPCCNPELP